MGCCWRRPPAASSSSTAVTVANARRAAGGEGSPRLLAAGVALATAIMFAAGARDRGRAQAEPAGPDRARALGRHAGGVGFAVAWVAIGAGRRQDGIAEVEFRNPFDFWSVVGFAVLLGAIIVLGRVLGETSARPARSSAHPRRASPTSMRSPSRWRGSPRARSAPRSAALAILGGGRSNTVSKVAIGAAIGRGWFAVEIAAMASGCIAVGAAALWLTFMLLRRLEWR